MGEFAREEYLKVHGVEVRKTGPRPAATIEMRMPGGVVGTKRLPPGSRTS